jgi:hypothetical protein
MKTGSYKMDHTDLGEEGATIQAKCHGIAAKYTGRQGDWRTNRPQGENRQQIKAALNARGIVCEDVVLYGAEGIPLQEEQDIEKTVKVNDAFKEWRDRTRPIYY